MNLLNLLRFFLLSTIILQLSSCGSREKLVYFQNTNNTGDSIYINQSNSKITIKIGDVIGVAVSAEDPRAVQPFYYSVASSGGSETLVGLTYTVDNDGYISLPKVGKIRVEGLTRSEANLLISEELSKFIIDPQVFVDIRSMQITMLGEINSPGVYPIKSDRLTILEAIAMGGDLSIFGMRKNILVVRNTDGIAVEHRIDITSNDLFQSPVYYLHQNDVVYVEPNQSKLNGSKQSASTGLLFSIIGLTLTIITLITR